MLYHENWWGSSCHSLSHSSFSSFACVLEVIYWDEDGFHEEDGLHEEKFSASSTGGGCEGGFGVRTTSTNSPKGRIWMSSCCFRSMRATMYCTYFPKSTRFCSMIWNRAIKSSGNWDYNEQPLHSDHIHRDWPVLPCCTKVLRGGTKYFITTFDWCWHGSGMQIEKKKMPTDSMKICMLPFR